MSDTFKIELSPEAKAIMSHMGSGIPVWRAAHAERWGIKDWRFERESDELVE